jgi:hypothetical protein
MQDRPTSCPAPLKQEIKFLFKLHVNQKYLKKIAGHTTNFSSATYSGFIESKSLSSAGRDDSIFPFPAIIFAGLRFAQIYQNLTK